MSDTSLEILVQETEIEIVQDLPTALAIEQAPDQVIEVLETVTEIEFVTDEPAEIVIEAIGTQGVKGDKGDQGEQGNPGSVGPPGQAAFNTNPLRITTGGTYELTGDYNYIEVDTEDGPVNLILPDVSNFWNIPFFIFKVSEDDNLLKVLGYSDQKIGKEEFIEMYQCDECLSVLAATSRTYWRII